MVIKIDQEFFDNLLIKAHYSERLRTNFDLRNNPSDKSQRMINALMPGTIIPIHRHRTSSETLILLHGVIDEIFFDDNKNEIERVHLNVSQGNYGVNIPINQWHTIEVFKPSIIIEIKDGPYQPILSEDILK